MNDIWFLCDKKLFRFSSNVANTLNDNILNCNGTCVNSPLLLLKHIQVWVIILIAELFIFIMARSCHVTIYAHGSKDSDWRVGLWELPSVVLHQMQPLGRVQIKRVTSTHVLFKRCRFTQSELMHACSVLSDYNIKWWFACVHTHTKHPTP